MNVEIFVHFPISSSFSSLISRIFPSALATIPFPIVLSGSLKKIRNINVFKNNNTAKNKKIYLSNVWFVIKINTKKIKHTKNDAKINDFEPWAIFILLSSQ